MAQQNSAGLEEDELYCHTYDHDEFVAILRRRLTEDMHERGLSLRKYSAFLEVSPAALSRFLRNERKGCGMELFFVFRDKLLYGYSRHYSKVRVKRFRTYLVNELKTRQIFYGSANKMEMAGFSTRRVIEHSVKKDEKLQFIHMPFALRILKRLHKHIDDVV